MVDGSLSEIDSVMKHELLRDIVLRSSLWMVMHSDEWTYERHA